MTKITNEESVKILLELKQKYQKELDKKVDTIITLLSKQIRDNLQVSNNVTSKGFSSINDRQLFLIEQRPDNETEAQVFRKIIQAVELDFKKNGFSVTVNFFNSVGMGYEGKITITVQLK